LSELGVSRISITENAFWDTLAASHHLH